MSFYHKTTTYLRDESSTTFGVEMLGNFRETRKTSFC